MHVHAGRSATRLLVLALIASADGTRISAVPRFRPGSRSGQLSGRQGGRPDRGLVFSLREVYATMGE